MQDNLDMVLNIQRNFEVPDHDCECIIIHQRFVDYKYEAIVSHGFFERITEDDYQFTDFENNIIPINTIIQCTPKEIEG